VIRSAHISRFPHKPTGLEAQNFLPSPKMYGNPSNTCDGSDTNPEAATNSVWT